MTAGTSTEVAIISSQRRPLSSQATASMVMGGGDQETDQGHAQPVGDENAQVDQNAGETLGADQCIALGGAAGCQLAQGLESQGGGEQDHQNRDHAGRNMDPRSLAAPPSTRPSLASMTIEMAIRNVAKPTSIFLLSIGRPVSCSSVSMALAVLPWCSGSCACQFGRGCQTKKQPVFEFNQTFHINNSKKYLKT